MAGHRSGAVKSNVGHLEGASGITGVIKTIMVLEKGIIPPNANFESLNPEIDAEFLNIKARDALPCTRHLSGPSLHRAWPLYLLG